MEAFVYFPVEEVDAPLIVGAVVSTTNEDETSILYQAYARAFGFLNKIVDVEVLKRLNKKNAETMGCIPVDFIHYH